MSRLDGCGHNFSRVTSRPDRCGHNFSRVTSRPDRCGHNFNKVVSKSAFFLLMRTLKQSIVQIVVLVELQQTRSFVHQTSTSYCESIIKYQSSLVLVFLLAYYHSQVPRTKRLRLSHFANKSKNTTYRQSPIVINF